MNQPEQTTDRTIPDEALEAAYQNMLQKTARRVTHPTRAEAIRAAFQVMRKGGTLEEAMEAWQQTLLQNGYRFVNGCLMFTARPHKAAKEERVKLATDYIIRFFIGDERHSIPLEKAKAIASATELARRVIEGNGTIGGAMRCALGPYWLQGWAS